MDLVPIQPQESENSQPPETAEPSSGNFSQKLPGIKKILSMASWVFLFSLAPVTVVILLSQNTVPGDAFYPAKRGMENVILAASAVHPATRVAFRTDLTDRRFSEAETLLLAKQDTQGLTEFIIADVKADRELKVLDDIVEKKRLEEKVKQSFQDYDQRLIVIEAQLAAAGKQIPGVSASTGDSQQPQPIAIVSTNTPVPVPTSPPGQPLVPTNTPVPQPTTVVGQPPLPTNTPVPLSTATRTPTPTPLPTPTPPPSTGTPGETITCREPLGHGSYNHCRGQGNAAQTCLQCLRSDQQPPPASLQNIGAREKEQEEKEEREEDSKRHRESNENKRGKD